MKQPQHPPPPTKHTALFEALLAGLYVNAHLVSDPAHWEDRARIMAIMKPELNVLHHASEPGASAEQLLAAFYYVCEALAWAPYSDEPTR